MSSSASGPSIPPSLVASSAPIHFDPDAGSGAEEFELGPAAPTAVGSFGCAVISGDDDVTVSPLIVSPLHVGRFEPFAAALKPSNAPWPAVVEGNPARVYWVSKGKLVRRKVSKDGVVGALEVLANDATDYTRVSAAQADGTGPDVVAYIGRMNSKEVERGARVWIEGKGARAASPEGAGATAVSAVWLGASKFALLSVDGRLSLSPVHARFLEAGAEATRLGEDHVVHVAGPAESQVDLAGMRLGDGPLALAALSRDTRTFGLISLRIGDAETEASSSWLLYPNGIAPAPIATGMLCGKPAAAFVQPEDASATARRVVMVGLVNAQGQIEDPRPIAVATTMRHLGLATIAQPLYEPPSKGQKPHRSVGAIVAYSADNRLRARFVSCR